MNLHSPQDKILIKNYLILMIQNLKLKKDNSITNNDIDYYQNIVTLLKNNDIDSIYAILEDPKQKENISHILDLTPQELADCICSEISIILGNNNVSLTEIDSDRLKYAVFKGNEDLIDNENSLDINHHTYLTENIETTLDTFEKLIKSTNPYKTSPVEFKEFAKNFEILTKSIAIQKLDQALSEKNKQKITDLQISYDTNEFNKPIYTIDLELINPDSNEKSKKILTEKASNSGFISTYIQNLCYSYLEATKNAEIDETSLTPEIITNKMYLFADYFRKLKDMSKYKLNILSNNTIGISASTSDEPSKDVIEACLKDDDRQTI